jgi:uncharacterized protein (TIGR02118 family)
MVKLTVLYAHPDDPDAFEEYYADTLVPLVDEIPNLQRYEAARVVVTPDGSEPPYYRIFEGYFEDIEQLQSGMSSPGRTGGSQRHPECRHWRSDGLHLRDRRVSSAFAELRQNELRRIPLPRTPVNRRV